MTSLSNAPADSLDVQQFIDSRPFSACQWMVFVLCFFIMVADGFDTAAIGFVAPALTREWGVEKLALGPVLSASLIGMALGALVGGPMADRFGRKPVLMLSVLAFGFFSLASGYADSITTLTVWRFLTGLGLGAATPIATTLLSESSPSRRRSLLLNGMFCGFTLGAATGGLGAALIIPEFGWRGVFVVGAVIPLVLAVISAFALRESVRFMVIRGVPIDAVKAAMKRLTGASFIPGLRMAPEAPVANSRGSSVRLILSPGFRTGTLMLWLTYFMGVLVFYLITSWLPTLIKESGLSLREASLLTALFPLGGTLGTVACGWLMDRMNPHRVIGTAYFFAGVFVWALGQGVGHPGILPALTFLSGFFVGSAIVSMPALAAMYYPTRGRASGVAWMLGIGRFGGIAGAVLGGFLLQLGLGTVSILGVLAVPALIGAAAVFYKDMAHRDAPVLRPAVA
jgi:AAHS family 4-hydroxybenzoate transporter-like MFS transporter